MIHWTLWAMMLAVVWAASAAPWRRGSMALAVSWLAAQAWWAITGDAVPIGVYRAADALVVVVLLTGAVGKLDWLIVGLFGAQWWAYDHVDGLEQWWALFWLAFAQMVLAGPWRQVQRTLFSNSHGPLRAGGAA